MKEPDCFDLRPWAKANRYKHRLEESYHAETPENRGDGRWYVEVLCRYGLIYPKGGDTLLAYAKRGVKHHLVDMGLEHHQYDGNNEVFRFPVDRLDEVAAVLKPKRRRTLDPGRARAISGLETVHAQTRKPAQETTQSLEDNHEAVLPLTEGV